MKKTIPVPLGCMLGAVFVHTGPMNPSNAALNCYAASNTNPIDINVNLTAGTEYTLTIIEDTFDQDGMTYQAVIDGPGNIFRINVSAIPTLSEWSLLALSGVLSLCAALGMRRMRSSRT